jgi:hypothetical protein
VKGLVSISGLINSLKPLTRDVATTTTTHQSNEGFHGGEFNKKATSIYSLTAVTG